MCGWGLVLALLLSALPAQAEGARYLIICPEEFCEATEPLAEWKTRKGMLAKVVPTSETGYSSSEIVDYITDAANSWDPAPEYILLAGDMGEIPMHWENFADGYSDVPYGSIDADDFLEIHVGRFPGRYSSEIETMVAKTLAYEREPVDDDDVYLNGAMLIREDWDDDDWLHYYGDANWAAGLMVDSGFDQVPVITAGTTQNPTGEARDLLEGGASYMAYHGVVSGSCGWPDFYLEADDLDNGPTLPVVVSYTCQTMAASGYECAGEEWMRAGSEHTPRGGVAYVGMAVSCYACAHWRSALRRGFWGYLFEDTGERDICRLAEAAEAGRLVYYAEFNSTSQYLGSLVYGDPELNLWTAVPRTMQFSHPPVIPQEAQTLTFTATLDGAARPDVEVCLMGDAGTYLTATTDESGKVVFEVEPSAETQLYVTATGRNLVPYEGAIGVGEPIPEDGDDDDDSAAGDDDDTGLNWVDPKGPCECRSAGGGASTALWPLLLAAAVVLRRRA